MCNDCCSRLLNVYWFCGNHILTKSCISTKLVNVKHIFHVCKHKNYLSNLLPKKVILWHCYKPVIFWLTESFENAFPNYNIKLFTVIIPFWAYFKHVRSIVFIFGNKQGQNYFPLHLTLQYVLQCNHWECAA